MLGEPMISNPIGWAQVKLIGGWRRLMLLAGVYSAVVLFIHLLFYRSMAGGVSLSSFAGGALVVMLFIEATILFIVGPNAIKRAVQRDFTTDMISSHRISAMTGHTAVFGYLTGPTSQVLVLTVVNWIACSILAMLAGPIQSVFAPTAVFAVLACLALMCWTFAVLVALNTKGGTSITGLIVILMVLANLQVVYALPGLSLLLATTGASDLRTASAGGFADASVFAAMFAQIVLGLTFFLAAARKFTRDDVLAFDAPLAFALLSLCAALCAVGLRFWRPAASNIMPPVATEIQVQTVATLIALVLVACLPVANAARNAAAWKKRIAKDPADRSARPMHFLLAPLLATFLVFAVLAMILAPILPEVFAEVAPSGWWQRAAWMVVVFCLALVAIAGVQRIIYTVSRKGMWITLVFMFLFWIVPPAADIAVGVVRDRGPAESLSALFGLSPLGMWIVLLTEGPAVSIWPGLVFQAVLAAVSVVLSRQAKY